MNSLQTIRIESVSEVIKSVRASHGSRGRIVWPDEVRSCVLDLVKHGLTGAEIERHTGIATQTFSSWLTPNNNSKPKSPSKKKFTELKVIKSKAEPTIFTVRNRNGIEIQGLSMENHQSLLVSGLLK